MNASRRREFLADVGRGMLMASVGPALALDLGLVPALADEPTQPLSFGAMEPLVALIEETPDDRILPALVDRLRKGTTLRELVAAGALASARTQADADYDPETDMEEESLDIHEEAIAACFDDGGYEQE